MSHQGNGGLNVAAWGLSSLIFSFIGGFYGLISFMEREKNYLFAKIGLGVSGVLLIVWIVLVIAGIAG